MAVLALWNATGFVLTAASEDANVAAGSLTNGSLYSFTTSNNGYSTGPEYTMAPQNASTDLAGAVSTNSYFYFTVTPDASYHLDLTSLTFKGARGGSSTPRGWGLRSSIDSYASTIATDTFDTRRTTWEDFSVDLTGGSYQELTGAVTFRLYIYAPSNATSVELDDITLNGTASLAHGSNLSALLAIGRGIA